MKWPKCEDKYYIIVKAPYGEEIIRTPKEAQDFIENMCNKCKQLNSVSQCSGDQTNDCNMMKKSVIREFLRK